MTILIIKLGATGDVVRTTPLLRRLGPDVTWIVAEKNLSLLQNLAHPVRAISWEQRRSVVDRTYDLVINLEDDAETSLFLQEIKLKQLHGAHLTKDGREMTYTEDSRAWFDLSLISRLGRTEADRLKFQNRSTYQELIFKGLGLAFAGETYLLPPTVATGMIGDIAISPVAGAVWPMKKWAYYHELSEELEAQGLTVNKLPTRLSLLEHLGDVRGHRCLVSGDSLPMHLALGSDVSCVSIFNCTSPWEIHDYGLQKKMISPRLAEFFYQRGSNENATNAISLEEVLRVTLAQLDTRVPMTTAL